MSRLLSAKLTSARSLIGHNGGPEIGDMRYAETSPGAGWARYAVPADISAFPSTLSLGVGEPITAARPSGGAAAVKDPCYDGAHYGAIIGGTVHYATAKEGPWASTGQAALCLWVGGGYWSLGGANGLYKYTADITGAWTTKTVGTLTTNDDGVKGKYLNGYNILLTGKSGNNSPKMSYVSGAPSGTWVNALPIGTGANHMITDVVWNGANYGVLGWGGTTTLETWYASTLGGTFVQQANTVTASSYNASIVCLSTGHTYLNTGSNAYSSSSATYASMTSRGNPFNNIGSLLPGSRAATVISIAGTEYIVILGYFAEAQKLRRALFWSADPGVLSSAWEFTREDPANWDINDHAVASCLGLGASGELLLGAGSSGYLSHAEVGYRLPYAERRVARSGGGVLYPWHKVAA